MVADPTRGIAYSNLSITTNIASPHTLILGPGGYRFGDCWRMGLPLEVLIVAVALPMPLWVWPL